MGLMYKYWGKLVETTLWGEQEGNYNSRQNDLCLEQHCHSLHLVEKPYKLI